MMAVDKEFTALVQAWEYRLGSLNQMVGSVEPRPIVWENIKAAVGHSTEPQAPLVLPEPPPPPPPPPTMVEEPPAEAPAVVEQAPIQQVPAIDDTNVIYLSSRVRRWRNVASFASAIAAALVVMLALQVYQPDLLPAGIRPKPRTQIVEVRHGAGAGSGIGAICRRAAAGRQLSRRSFYGRCRDKEFYGS
jgi:hypothetical protein